MRSLHLKIHRKTPLQVLGCSAAASFKKLQHRCYAMNIEKVNRFVSISYLILIKLCEGLLRGFFSKEEKLTRARLLFPSQQ